MGRRRISRSLAGALIIAVVLGVAFYLKNLSSSRADQTATPAPSQLQAGQPPANPTSPVNQPQVAPATRPAAKLASSPLTDAQAKLAAGDLLAARKILNDALLAGNLSPADAESAKKTIADINQTIVFSPRLFADDEFGGVYTVQSGDLLKKIADKYDVTWELLARLNNLSDPRKLRAGATLKIVRGPFNAIISKSRFTMDIYIGPPGEKGSMYVTTYSVGLGKDDSTPTGTWLVEPHKKLKNPTYYSPRGEGVIDADDPKNPLGERWIGLSGIDGHAVGKSSYGIHGTIDESSIGRTESLGCIRMKNADVEWVFDLLVEGKSVVIVKE